MCISKVNKKIDVNFLVEEPEGLYFDRKRAKVSISDAANHIAAFANSNGGILAIGVMDNGEIEGFKTVGNTKLNEFQKCVTNHLKPCPLYNYEILKVKLDSGENDSIILFHVDPSMNFVVRNNKGDVYCRQGDSSIKLTHDQIKNLEYDRKERNFETEIVMDSSVNDIDEEIVELYKQKLETTLDNISVLKARGYLKEINGEIKFTNAGILLFGINPSLYLPSSRFRIVKFEGDEFLTGEKMNIVKDKVFDKNIIRILSESRDFINTQLREFNYLTENGTFEKYFEYPEFAWYEGIVNAITHRDYSNSGEHIIMKIYNNRIEILSPGKLGGFVTIDTIKVKRYSRNPMIARALNELGIVKELNEGVKRIFTEMKNFNLNEPVYTEPDRNSVLLLLENNILNRSNCNQRINSSEISIILDDLTYLEQEVINFITSNKQATRGEIEKLINRSKTSTVTVLNKLIDKKLIVWTGTSKQDIYGRYILKSRL